MRLGRALGSYVMVERSRAASTRSWTASAPGSRTAAIDPVWTASVASVAAVPGATSQVIAKSYVAAPDASRTARATLVAAAPSDPGVRVTPESASQARSVSPCAS
ncbi:hypothetical protein D3C74_391330 [compost metagenome]